MQKIKQFKFSACGASAFQSWFSTTFLNNVVDAMTSRLPQVCKLWFRVGKSMLPVTYLAKEILMSVNNSVCQLARRFWWAVPVYNNSVCQLARRLGGRYLSTIIVCAN